MLDKTVDLRATREEARADLKLAEAELARLDAGKGEASKSREAFENWRAEHATWTSEKERQLLRIETLDKELARTDTAKADDEWRARHAALVISIPKLTQRIPVDIAKANSIHMNLVRDVAKSNVELQAVNANLPEGLDRLQPADFLARALPSLPREVVSRERIWLWVATRTGGLIGDQDAVKDLGGGKGVIDNGITPEIHCRAALFDKISFHPAVPAQRPEPLWSIRLVRPDGPGVLFDGSALAYPQDALAELMRSEHRTEPATRSLQTELVPVPSETAGN